MTGAADHLRGLVVARSIADRDGVSLESVDADEAASTRPGADAVADRVAEKLSTSADRLPPDETGDTVEFRRAREILVAAAGRTARKLDRDPTAELTRGDEMAFEAVVRTDGTRPSLLVRDDAVDPGHPLAGDWQDVLAQTSDDLRDTLRAVGRVEPANPTARNFFGTAWLVDADEGLALTNLHVVEAMWRRLPQFMEMRDGRFRIIDGAFVDFVAEAGSARTNRYRVVEAVPSGIDGTRFSRLDAAVLRLEPTERSAPGKLTAVPAVADLDGPRGNTTSFCVVGFPAPPQFAGGMHEGIDWTWVNSALFGNVYGVKRLAPGIAHRPLGSVADDPRNWVFGHDLTTLRGNSGSPLLNWLGSEPGAFGLHFAGASVDSNYAHAIVNCAEELHALGVPVTQPEPG